jgi:hypothetical protein
MARVCEANNVYKFWWGNVPESGGELDGMVERKEVR